MILNIFLGGGCFMARYRHHIQRIFGAVVFFGLTANISIIATAKEQPEDAEQNAQDANPDSPVQNPEAMADDQAVSAQGDDENYYTITDPEEEGPDEVEPGVGGDDGSNGAAPDLDEPGIREPPQLIEVERQAATAPAPSSGPVPRSFGGFRVHDARAPWQAQIYYPGTAKRWVAKIPPQGTTGLWKLQHYCGGALIAQDWVVTAGHCIDQDMVESGYRVRLGQEDISQPGGLDYKIDRIVKHTNSNMYNNDIALLHIVADKGQPARNRSQIREIPLAGGTAPNTGDAVTGYGWGVTKDGGEIAHALLMGVTLSTEDQVECAKKLPGKIHPAVVCAIPPRGSATGIKTCRGDSGGPLVNQSGQLVGIVSWGSTRCADDSAPDIYVRVSSYASWIKVATGGAVQ
jgi:Trypsin